jgi:hypothetical protein
MAETKTAPIDKNFPAYRFAKELVSLDPATLNSNGSIRFETVESEVAWIDEHPDVKLFNNPKFKDEEKSQAEIVADIDEQLETAMENLSIAKAANALLTKENDSLKSQVAKLQADADAASKAAGDKTKK